MSDDLDVRLVQQIYEQFARGDVEGLTRLLDEDVVWELPSMERVPFAGTWRGRDGVRQFLQKLGESQEVVEFRPEQFIAQAGSVVALGRFVMRVKATGRTSASAWAHVWRVADGRASAFREYVDTAAVVRAHGDAPAM